MQSLDDLDDATVELTAKDGRHLLHAIRQACYHEDVELAYAEILVRTEGQVVRGMLGSYVWDGVTCPEDAESTVETVYGDLSWAMLSIGSAVDDRRYESALPLHGFLPTIDLLEPSGEVVSADDLPRRSIRDFAKANTEYAKAVAAIFERNAVLPVEPTGAAPRNVL